ncbi:uncharacterized protein LOC130713255 [Lotus japonicus]|uniref:uncharacterized protein LOC130713255 n=1 Tax=Lotus japonicus TaxID=34305 RepID=UPI0025906B86|nr:uncharacterized protein LOC130713255 [Lotus japonicus]
MGSWDGNSWSWNLLWRRPLREREGRMLLNLMTRLNQVTLRQGIDDKLLWLNNYEEGYRVSSAYAHIKGFWNSEPESIFKQIWRLIVPANIKSFMWKVSWDRLQTKINLAKRGVAIDEDGLKWLAYDLVLPEDCRTHFLQHSQNRWKKKQKRCWNSIWAAVVWSMWVAHNNVVFNNEAADSEQIFEMIQWRSWSWFSALEKEFRCSGKLAAANLFVSWHILLGPW